MHVNTGIVLVLKFVPECCWARFLLVVSPGEIPTFLSSSLWSLWLFLIRYSGLTYLFCLLWRCIHHHIKLPLIFMGIYEFWGECGSVSFDWLDLVSVVLLRVRTSLAVISFGIITGTIVVVAFFARYIFAPESTMSSMLLLGGLGWISIQCIKWIV